MLSGALIVCSWTYCTPAFLASLISEARALSDEDSPECPLGRRPASLTSFSPDDLWLLPRVIGGVRERFAPPYGGTRFARTLCVARIALEYDRYANSHIERGLPLHSSLIKESDVDDDDLWVDSCDQADGFGPADFVLSSGMMFICCVTCPVSMAGELTTTSRCEMCVSNIRVWVIGLIQIVINMHKVSHDVAHSALCRSLGESVYWRPFGFGKSLDFWI